VSGQIVMPWGTPTAREADFWPTPEAVTVALLGHCPPPPGRVLDPCAGNGAILRVLKAYGYEPEAVELREEETEALEAICGPTGVVIADWLEVSALTRLLGGWPSIVTNPPFSIAQDITRACLRADAAYLALLLRLNVLGSNPWAPIWIETPPTGIWPLLHRPSFSGDGKTDACNYAWFTWEHGKLPAPIRPV